MDNIIKKFKLKNGNVLTIQYDETGLEYEMIQDDEAEEVDIPMAGREIKDYCSMIATKMSQLEKAKYGDYE